MPRRPGPYGARDSAPLAVRVPNDLVNAIYNACGGPERFPEWARNVFRRAVGVPLDTKAGYAEGYMSGWREANEKFKAALKKV